MERQPAGSESRDFSWVMLLDGEQKIGKIPNPISLYFRLPIVYIAWKLYNILRVLIGFWFKMKT
jgi:hypothetical protein